MSKIIDLGKVTLIKREKVIPPDDGIHRKGKDGKIKGVHSVMSENYGLIPKGSVGFYLEGFENGAKVYLGKFPDKPWPSKKEVVQKAYRNLVNLTLADLSPSPKKIIQVKVKYTYKGKKVSKTAYALGVERCHYPTHIWNNYAKGLPYIFDSLSVTEHPDHSSEGYFEFCKKLKVFCNNSKMVLSCFDYRKKGDLPKLGDVLYCMKKKRWQIVDAD